MHYKLFFCAGLLMLAVSGAFCQSYATPDCSSLKKYKLQYLGLKDSSAYVLLSNDSAIEYHNNGRYTIRARVQWVDECEYNMILSSVTIPGFAFHPGDVMNIRIDKIIGDVVYYFSTINGNSWQGKLRIIQ
jgi:hypothetical protein